MHLALFTATIGPPTRLATEAQRQLPARKDASGMTITDLTLAVFTFCTAFVFCLRPSDHHGARVRKACRFSACSLSRSRRQWPFALMNKEDWMTASTFQGNGSLRCGPPDRRLEALPTLQPSTPGGCFRASNSVAAAKDREAANRAANEHCCTPCTEVSWPRLG
jgi:hypothetical protein